ncbi:MAG: methyltransferase FkbM family [uncultured bacterium]|nr:MAG: methyltransferase FkbM family [uncultured bacterium]
MDFRSSLRVSFLYDLFGKRSYAQSGEDLIAWGELGGRKQGYYIDVGAFHPKVFSNTYMFYKKGWRGICIDPNPEMEELFRKARPGDKFLNMGVGESRKVMEYFEFEDGAANTFSPEQAKKNQVEAGRKQIGTRMVAIMPLKMIFEKYLPKGGKIDLLSVDVEGMDLEVLKSNDWKKYRPEMVVCEDLEFDYKNWKKSDVTAYLDSLGYDLIAKTPYSLIFKTRTAG